MLRKQLETAHGFLVSETIDGVLFKADISTIPDAAFDTRGINRLLGPLGITLKDIRYVRPRMDTPCIYGACEIIGDLVAVESCLTWKDLKRMKRQHGGVFYISINVDGAYSDQQRLLISWDVESVPMDSLVMSPVVDLLAEHSHEA